MLSSADDFFCAGELSNKKKLLLLSFPVLLFSGPETKPELLVAILAKRGCVSKRFQREYSNLPFLVRAGELSFSKKSHETIIRRAHTIRDSSVFVYFVFNA